MGSTQISRPNPQHRASGPVNAGALRTYYSYVNGKQLESSDWVYVLHSDALLDDVFSSLRLKRKLEQGKIRSGDLPHTVVGKVAKADPETVGQALKAAAAAAPEWCAVPLDIRLNRFAELLHARLTQKARDIAAVLVEEGHPLPLAQWQVSGMLEVFGADSADFYRSQMLQEFDRGERRLKVRRRPDGVVCLNPPQNAPLSSAILGATSIMAGNALVVRAPRSGPLGVMYVLQDIVAPVLEELGAPPGVLNVVCGDPAPMLNAWLESPYVDDIIYFGSSENGIEFEKRCLAHGKKPILELAGNDVVTVWKDADTELAAEALIEGFYGSGQLCMIPNQVLVHPDAAPRLLEHLTRQVEKVRPGRPNDPDVLLTPVLRNEKFFSCLDDALAKGAELLCGGHAMQLDGTRDPHGIFLEPTVVVVNGMAGARELDAVRHETFFPLLPVIVAEPAGDEELLRNFIEFVETNAYGLRNSLWARDTGVIDHFSARIRGGGLLKVNDSHIGFLSRLPTHGGTGLTGGVFGEANYPILRTSHLQGVSVSTGSRPREAVFGAWQALVDTDRQGGPADQGRAQDPDADADTLIRLYRNRMSKGRATLGELFGKHVELESEGAWVTGGDGRRFLNCGGYGVFLMGARHPVVMRHVTEQLHRHPVATRIFLEPQAARAADALVAHTPEGLERVHFACGGAEAVEAAIKLARTQGRDRLVATHGGYHGKTMGALSLTGKDVFQEPFRPLLPGVDHIAYGDAEALEELLRTMPGRACVVIEPVQGEAGVVLPPDGYLAAVQRLCRTYDALFVLDEIQTGLGRLGTWWGADQEGVTPDILLTGKGLGGGVLPVSAVVATRRAFSAFDKDPYLHTSTFSGAPLAMAAVRGALAAIGEDDLVARARDLGASLLTDLRRIAHEHFGDLVHEVRGRGLLIGIEFTEPGLAGELLIELIEQGVIANHSLNSHMVLRFTPPAILRPQEADLLREAFDRACRAQAARYNPTLPTLQGGTAHA